jgi:hypothetical protein
MARRAFTGEPCPHMPHLYKTEAAHLAHNERNRAYYEQKQSEYGPRQFESDGCPLRLRLQRLLATIRQRVSRPGRYAKRGIQCHVTFDDLLFAWNRDDAASMRRPSIDRKDNDGHYEPSNIRFIELADNIRHGVTVRESLKSHRKPLEPTTEVA